MKASSWIVLMAVLGATPAYAGPGLKLGLSPGYGQMQSESGMASRSMGALDIRALPGWRIGPLLVGAMAQYNIVEQLTDPTTVANINLRGSGYLLGAGVGLSFGPIHLQGSYELYGKYTLGNVTAAGTSTTYSKPAGYTAILGWSIFPKVSMDAVYGTHTYGTSTINGVDTDVSANKLMETHYGVGLSIHAL